MKIKTYIWATFAALSLAACDGVQSSGTSLGPAGEAPVDFTGQYAMGTNCSDLEGAMRITADTVRISQTICNIKSSRYVNTSSTEYALTGCQSEGTAQADRKAIISEVEDGQILLSGWVADEYTFNMCG